MAAKTLNLTALASGMPGLSASMATAMAEAAAVCLETKPHVPGVRFPKVGMMTDDLDLIWTPATEQHKRTFADKPEATEFGAAAIAILFVNELTGKVVVERSVKGTGFDYWLADTEPPGPPFNTALARLEVSGILAGSEATIASRVAAKKKQMEPSDALAPGMVGIVEFGTPIAHIESK